MNGAQTKETGYTKVRTMMRLRRKESDASKCKPEGQAFSQSVAPLVVGANFQARLLAQVGGSSSHQWPALSSNVGALTNRSCGTLRAPQLSR